MAERLSPLEPVLRLGSHGQFENGVGELTHRIRGDPLQLFEAGGIHAPRISRHAGTSTAQNGRR